MALLIDDELDGANVTVIAADDDGVRVAPEPDPDGEYCQWFAFRSTDEEGDGGVLILDTRAMTWPEALEDYRVFASFDGGRWRRIDTASSDFDEDGARSIVWSHPSGVREARFALWEPYTALRRRRTLARMRRAHGVATSALVRTLDGEALAAVCVRGGPKRLWVIARQHAGEVMAEWFAEGLLERLTNGADPEARALRAEATVWVVPCVNVDGAARGHHRVNAAGVDLNRAWLDAAPRSSPEVHALREALEQTGVDLFIDVHGDERARRAFAARNEGNPGYTERLAEAEARFVDALAARFDAFDRESSYPLDAPGEADLRAAANYVGERFDCPALTLELPFGGEGEGWDARDAKALGAASVFALYEAVVDR